MTAYNNLAWIQATFPDAEFRVGKEAVSMATKACELTDWKNGDCFDTLAAAHAEQGDFESAIKWQTKYIELATKESDRESGRERLALYKARKPYRDGAK